MNALFNRVKSKIPIGLFKLIKARFLNVKFPHAIQFNITFRCNQRCVYCGIYNDKREEMGTESICKMIDEFVSMGTSRLSLTGGEPLMRKDLPEVIRYARSRGLFVSLATNGSLVPKRIGELSGVNSVNMTLDGPKHIHDKQRGSGNFEKVLVALELLKRKKIPTYLVTVLTRNNCGLLEQILQIAKSLDVRLLIQPVFYVEQSHANNLEGFLYNKCDDKEMIEALGKLIRLKEQRDPNIILSKRYYRKVISCTKQGVKMVCRNGGSLFCTISPEGRVAPCNLLVRDKRWLNGNEVGFRKAFFDMPTIKCSGCISSLIDIDDMYSLKPDVVWNYYGHYLSIYSKPLHGD